MNLAMGMDTEQFKVGDKVKALCGPIGHERERDCVVVELRADGKYAVNAEMLGQFYLHFVDADKVWVERAAEPAKEAQTPVEVKEALEKLAPYNDHTVEVTEKDIAAINQAIDTLGAVKFSSKTVEPPADPPKPERIRRTKEEIALGVPHKDILAYRADPEGWLKTEREATEAFHEVIDKAIDDHWEDKAQEYLEPPAYKPEIILKMLGWAPLGQDHGLQMYSRSDVAIEEVLVRHVYEDDSFFIESVSKPEYTYQWNKSEDFRMWLMRCTEWIEELLDGGVCDDNDLEGNDKPAEAVLSKKEITEPELMPQMEIDSLKPEVYNYEVMGEVPDGYVLARERFNGIRWYVMYFKKAKKLAYLPGTTSVDDNTSQPPAYLTKWRYDMVARYGSVDAMEGFVDDTAAYGTIMHTLIAWYINGSLPVIGSQSWKDQVCMLITLQDGRIPDIYYPLWDRRLRKDLTCWNQFMIDRNVKVHLMEFACGSTDLGVAGQIDLVCTMDFNRARVNAILDMKSGKKSTGQGNTKATQLGIYKLLFDRVFPDWKYGDTGKSPMGITKFFNWHPNDYSEVPSKDTGLVVPTYELVNQTDSVDWKEIDLQMKLFKHRTQGVKPGSNARFSIEGELKPFTDNQDLIKGGLRQDTYIEKYGLEVCDD